MPAVPIESAAAYLPSRRSLPSLKRAANGCRGCPLWEDATQAVLGEGSVQAAIMIIGEQPGHEEDLSGRPFVGPAGRLLDRALAAAEIERGAVYVTNAVKHFKWTPRGKRRLHQKPTAREVRACQPWLNAEVELIQPQVIVCLGATAAQAVFGREFRVSQQRGQPVESPLAPHALATVHPSSILRVPERDDRRRELLRFIDDLKVASALHRSERTAPDRAAAPRTASGAYAARHSSQ